MDTISYDAFGHSSQSMADAGGSYGFTGRQVDAETDLQYNRARYYDSAVGRWISQDPLAFSAGDSNLYRYVNNQPSEGTDPSGLAEIQSVSLVQSGNFLTKDLQWNGLTAPPLFGIRQTPYQDFGSYFGKQWGAKFKSFGLTFPLFKPKFTDFSTMELFSTTKKERVILGTFAILVNLNEHEKAGGRVKKVTLQETGQQFFWINGTWHKFVSLTTTQSQVPVDQTTAAILKGYSGVSIGTQKGNSFRTLFLGDAPGFQLPPPGQPAAIQSRKVFATFSIEDQSNKIRTIKYNFIVGVDPATKLPQLEVTQPQFTN